MSAEKTQNTEQKIIKVAKGCRIAANIGYYAAIVGCVVLTVLAIVLPLTCKPVGCTKAELAVILGGLALEMFFMINVLWQVVRIFHSIVRAQAAFNPGVTKYMRRLGIALIMIAVIPSFVINMVLAIVAPDSDFNTPLEVGGVIAGLVFYALSYFFAYGAELKKQDETTL